MCHWVGNDYRCQDFFNPVDGDDGTYIHTYEGPIVVVVVMIVLLIFLFMDICIYVWTLLLLLYCKIVPVPHFGLALTEEQFHDLADRVRKAGVKFIIEPHLRFKGQPGEQWTMFFKDPSNNNLEFKAMTTIDNLFAKYNVVDK